MSETEKLIAEIATRLLLAHVQQSGLSKDMAFANRAIFQAAHIVKCAQGKGGAA